MSLGSGICKDIRDDIVAMSKRHRVGAFRIFFTNRGFHALFFYRLAHLLMDCHLDFFSMVLTRIVQIFYGIDIDYRAKIEGGVVILHGVGIAIGEGAFIGAGTEIYHGVTLGIRGEGEDDNSPSIGRHCMLGTGCKILGPVKVGDRCVIGANVVLSKSVPDNSFVKLPDPVIRPRCRV